MPSYYAEKKRLAKYLRKNLSEIRLDGRKISYDKLLYELSLEFELGKKQFEEALELAMSVEGLIVKDDVIMEG